ncbi:toll/interleukin-1 receptor domain-containing protein [Chryseolinea sp. H1M3-3]|uniref:toll/interleukin-1 receptor domain-containing protein n=1 Tax=Chryseolinea sp. H1M3-3 TaxID=3034144 RepID=UPI0023EB0272|nr:toll/interleukin-1 receptor domain-containing protein [Chryseolinea sp. H1M3-3]
MSEKTKIFISHSQKDIDYIRFFVDHILRLGLDITADRIFCSSMEGHGVHSGQYIPERLRKEINDSVIALLFISRNYKDSEVCLNEVGAAWATLEPESVIFLLLPDIEFSDVGFLNVNKLGLKIFVKKDILHFVEDNKQKLNSNYNLSRLDAGVDAFLEKISGHQASTKSSSITFDKQDPNDSCWDDVLYPLHKIIVKAIPALSDGIHRIEDAGLQTQIMTDLSNSDFLNKLWYRFKGGDSYVERIRRSPSGTWFISGWNWEIKISDMWVCMDSGLASDFILIKSDGLEGYRVVSDVGGISFMVGITRDGTIVSDNERLSGYARLGGVTIDLSELDVEPRLRSENAHWIFLVSDYHKLGYNADQTIGFCEKLDRGEIEVNRNTLREFTRSLRNHPAVTRWR